VATLKMGVKKDGSMTAFEYTIYWDAGAYVEYGANVVNASGLSATGPYRIPNVKIDALCMYTNLPPVGRIVGFGYSELLLGSNRIPHALHNQLNMDVLTLSAKMRFRKAIPWLMACP
jgi:carbon-monoxide dehydrogenase large subunit